MTNTKLIPMDEITPEARRIAVAWIDNYVPHGSIMPEIAQKQKLASDIMNYASLQCAEMKEALAASERIRMSDAQSAIREANSLRGRIEQLQEEVERLRGELRMAYDRERNTYHPSMISPYPFPDFEQWRKEISGKESKTE